MTPDTVADDRASLVEPDGDVYSHVSYNRVGHSYGRIQSPVPGYSAYAYYVYPSGDVYENYNDFVYYSSYGRIYLAGLVYVLQLYVFLCNGRRKYDYICSRIFLRANLMVKIAVLELRLRCVLRED